jgi:hypothetical protein
MRAALPYIDDFLPANNLDSLVALGHALESVDDRRAPSRGQRQPGRAMPSASSSP